MKKIGMKSVKQMKSPKPQAEPNPAKGLKTKIVKTALKNVDKPRKKRY
jgi:hypothetical protein